MRYPLPKGFLASGLHCGIKRFKKDLALIYSKVGCKGVAVFTRNKVKAAPLVVSKAVLKKGKPIRAVIVNSGNANCCTGWYGVRDAKRMIRAASSELKLEFNNVLVSSTGIIGKRLPIKAIEDSVPKLVKLLSERGLPAAANAILTTDRKIKIESEKFNVGAKTVQLSGFAKGAGMIQPNMATMLAFIMTDARVDKDVLKSALGESCDDTFNRITIDGDTSTNDTVVLLANGVACNKTIKRGTKEYRVFLKALKRVSFELSKQIVIDGEGATKFVTVHVKNAQTSRDANRIARAVANSCLVKTSVHGENPNWGRVASSVGASDAGGIKQNRLEIHLDGIPVFKGGRYIAHSRDKESRIYKRKAIEIMINLNTGKKSAKIWTCDLSKRYVEINSHYMT